MSRPLPKSVGFDLLSNDAENLDVILEGSTAQKSPQTWLEAPMLMLRKCELQ